MSRLFGSALLLLALPLAGQSINNNQSCDIAVTPAATLLLPYFEVDVNAPVGTGETTLFTVTNTSRYPQIGRVTLWTDQAFPVLTFHLFLTGYDVQSINMFDVVVRGIVAHGAGVHTAQGSPVNTPGGALPFDNAANPNFVAEGELSASFTCAGLPVVLPDSMREANRRALTIGRGTCPSAIQIGGNHPGRAIGYATIDVVSHCSPHFSSGVQQGYFAGATAPLLFDNVLLGDYQHVGPKHDAFASTTHDALGNPMVHIRAVPEGGLSGAGGGEVVPTNLPFTFYDRYTPPTMRTADRRQPLPSTWVARFIEGGTGNFITDLEIWREGNGDLPTCATAQRDAHIMLTNLIRFDEHENARGLGGSLVCTTCAPSTVSLPATSRQPSNTSRFPTVDSLDLGGWLFLNLSSGASYVAVSGRNICSPTLSAQRPGFPSCIGLATPGMSGSHGTTQNWVTTSMFGRILRSHMAGNFNATALGNGCTPAPSGGAQIGPPAARNP